MYIYIYIYIGAEEGKGAGTNNGKVWHREGWEYLKQSGEYRRVCKVKGGHKAEVEQCRDVPLLCFVNCEALFWQILNLKLCILSPVYWNPYDRNSIVYVECPFLCGLSIMRASCLRCLVGCLLILVTGGVYGIWCLIVTCCFVWQVYLMSYCHLLFCVAGVFEQPSQADPQLSHRKWVRSSPYVELIIIIIMNTLIKHLMSR